jgi:hypothetical protein
MSRILKVLGVLALALLLLAVPGADPVVPEAPERGVDFTWSQDAYWQELEQRFTVARDRGCEAVEPGGSAELLAVRQALGGLTDSALPPHAVVFDSIETRFFELAPLAAACGDLAEGYASLQMFLRDVIKDQSRHWDMSSAAARERAYRLLYGSRLAVEEVILQHPDRVPALQLGRNERRLLPSIEVAGVRVYSGDILVSRGGYPTSALIARGSDFPGNFSHVALVHVDSATGVASAIEALIDRGVTITTPEAYLADKKLRIMVLRPRGDLPAIEADPLLPHRAASRMLERARRGRIPYDFAMDYTNPGALFCSEVASSVYRDEGVVLWTGLSTISAPGLRRWLAAFGVEHFETQEPSDLEYDPQLDVVAEWRDPAALMADRIDNAVIDAMLEGADAGDELIYSRAQLPLARLAKGWSWAMNRIGRQGPIPEGMSARAALQNRAFTERQRRIAADVHDRIAVLERDQGYPLTYRLIVDLARSATRRHPAA